MKITANKNDKRHITDVSITPVISATAYNWFSTVPVLNHHKSIDTFSFIALGKSVTQNIKSCYWKTLPIERNPFPAMNQTLSSYRVHISPTK